MNLLILLLWRNRHEQSVRTQNHENRNDTMEPRLRASPRHGGQDFFELFVTDPPRGDPSAAAAIIVNGRVFKKNLVS